MLTSLFRRRRQSIISDGIQDRGAERGRRMRLTAITSLMARFGSIGVLLLTVPLAHSVLGSERFGMWMVISSVGAVMAFADLGIGNGIVNLIARASGLDDLKEMRAVASSAFVTLTVMGIFFAAAILVAYPFFDWASVFRVESPEAVREAGPSIVVFVLCFAVGLPSSVGPKVQLGLQQAYISNVWTGIGGISSLVAVFGVLWLDGSVPMLVLALFGSQQLAIIANTVHFFVRSRNDLTPKISFVRTRLIKSLFRLGLGFFALQFVAVAVFRLDTLFVTQLFGPIDAGIYATVERMFSLVLMLVGFYLAPLWPAYGEAASRGDHDWVSLTLRRSTIVATAASATMVAGITVFHPWILGVLLNDPVSVPLVLIVGFAVMKIFEATGTSASMFLNGLGVVNSQILFAIIMGVVATILKMTIARDLGIASFIWITAVCYLLLSLAPMLIIAHRTLRRLS